jgi:hypothetical protein
VQLLPSRVRGALQLWEEDRSLPGQGTFIYSPAFGFCPGAEDPGEKGDKAGVGGAVRISDAS